MEKQQKEVEHFGLIKDVYQPEFNTTRGQTSKIIDEV
jgi:hypothetical protein